MQEERVVSAHVAKAHDSYHVSYYPADSGVRFGAGKRYGEGQQYGGSGSTALRSLRTVLSRAWKGSGRVVREAMVHATSTVPSIRSTLRRTPVSVRNLISWASAVRSEAGRQGSAVRQTTTRARKIQSQATLLFAFILTAVTSYIDRRFTFSTSERWVRSAREERDVHTYTDEIIEN